MVEAGISRGTLLPQDSDAIDDDIGVADQRRPVTDA